MAPNKPTPPKPPPHNVKAAITAYVAWLRVFKAQGGENRHVDAALEKYERHAATVEVEALMKGHRSWPGKQDTMISPGKLLEAAGIESDQLGRILGAAVYVGEVKLRAFAKVLGEVIDVDFNALAQSPSGVNAPASRARRAATKNDEAQITWKVLDTKHLDRRGVRLEMEGFPVSIDHVKDLVPVAVSLGIGAFEHEVHESEASSHYWVWLSVKRELVIDYDKENVDVVVDESCMHRRIKCTTAFSIDLTEQHNGRPLSADKLCDLRLIEGGPHRMNMELSCRKTDIKVDRVEKCDVNGVFKGFKSSSKNTYFVERFIQDHKSHESGDGRRVRLAEIKMASESKK